MFLTSGYVLVVQILVQSGCTGSLRVKKKGDVLKVQAAMFLKVSAQFRMGALRLVTRANFSAIIPDVPSGCRGLIVDLSQRT